ncbi:MAG: glucose-6-phosphate isomerase, partial [Muribaculaceae bacterium]|nr:glucose-6-phosphate isomerase [Muribaculaceae bacterium]
MNSLSVSVADSGIDDKALAALAPETDEALNKVLNGSGEGADFLGWVNLPSETIESDLAERIETVAARLRAECDTVVCIGIGGSYLGAKAVIEALKPTFAQTTPEILFAGQNIG